MDGQPQPAGASGKRFGDVAVELGLLTEGQVANLLVKQESYLDMGIPMRIDEIAVEMGLITREDCNVVLRELKKFRTAERNEKPELQDDSEFGELIPPFQLGPFEVEERLGGLMGTVFKAYDTRTKTRVALKMLSAAMRGDQPLLDRFQREIKAAKRLSHPNIVSFLDAGILEGRTYFSMEFVPGESLNQMIERYGCVPEAKALRLMIDVSMALYHAHANGIVHRDVKPENILIDKKGRGRLTDLGLVKLVTSDTQLTETGIAVGTPHYIAPEQARGAKMIDGRADLYSLGATLFHMLCGRPPFDGNASEVMRQHVFTDPPDPHLLAPDISIQARNLILKLLSKEPVRRVQSADALSEAIQRILDRMKPGEPGSSKVSPWSVPPGDSPFE